MVGLGVPVEPEENAIRKSFRADHEK